MEQLGLIFDGSRARPVDPPRARRDDPHTSQLAAAKASSFAASHRARILEALERPGTIKDLAARTGLDHVAIARRMGELERSRKAAPTTEVRDGCRVWART